MGALELAAYGLRSADVDVVLDLPRRAAAGARRRRPAAPGGGEPRRQRPAGAARPRRAAAAGDRAPGPRATAAVLEVADNGPGMAADVAKRAFEPFFTTKPQGVGTGVGLSVCHGIVAAHGGRIELDTARGDGRALPRAPAAVARRAGARRGPAAAPQPIAGGRVLVVDDEPEIAALLAERLGADGLTVATASSGRRALAALEAGGRSTRW